MVIHQFCFFSLYVDIGSK
uniref:Uncharacterized protein n=1 Tax=Arundo donax TaxID=35708 RepID=A0A0A9EIE4_ARUDO